MPEERTPTRLWGGRFGSGPAEALARLSVSVQFDWRLAPYDLLASRAHARVLHRAGLLDDRRAGPDAGRAGRASRPACRDGTFRPDRRRRGRAHRAGTRPAGAARLARRQAAGRPQPQRPGRHRPAAVPARPRPARGVPAGRAGDAPCSARPSSTLTTPAPGMTHLQHAQPVLFAHQLLAHVPGAGPGRRPAARLGQAGRGLPARLGRAGRLVAAAGPGGGRGRARLRPRPRPTRWTRSATGTSPPSSASRPRCSACTCPGSARRSCSGPRTSSAGSRSTTPTRPARRSCRRRRTRTWPSWPGARPAG